MNPLQIAGLGAVGLALCAGAALAQERIAPVFLINESPSLPRGVYARSAGRSPHPGDVVAVPQPPATRAYLSTLSMHSSVLLLKRVAAVGGESVCRRGDVLILPRSRLAVLQQDRRGVALPQWRSCRRLEAGEMFLIGDTRTSFDSRYFGPVRKDRIVGVYREVVRW